MDDSCRNIDQRLLNAYRDTVYQVEQPPLAIEIGVMNAALDVFLQANDALQWAFITAWNPRSQLLPFEENKRRQQELIAKVEKAGYPYYKGKGMGKSNDWAPEESLLILNIAKAEAIRLAQYFEQNALVFGMRERLPELLLTAGC